MDRVQRLIKENVPNVTETRFHRRRYSRSGWSTFLSWLGIASNDDLYTVNDNLKKLQSATQLGFQEFNKHVNRFHTFMQHTTSHA